MNIRVVKIDKTFEMIAGILMYVNPTSLYCLAQPINDKTDKTPRITKTEFALSIVRQQQHYATGGMFSGCYYTTIIGGAPGCAAMYG